MKSIHDPRYMRLVEHLKAARKQRKVTQVELSERLGQQQSYVAKVENLERRIDVVELYDWLTALDHRLADFLEEIDWLAK